MKLVLLISFNYFYLVDITLIIFDCIFMIDTFFVSTFSMIIIFAAATINANLTSITTVAGLAVYFLFVCSAAVFSISISVFMT